MQVPCRRRQERTEAAKFAPPVTMAPIPPSSSATPKTLTRSRTVVEKELSAHIAHPFSLPSSTPHAATVPTFFICLSLSASFSLTLIIQLSSIIHTSSITCLFEAHSLRLKPIKRASFSSTILTITISLFRRILKRRYPSSKCSSRASSASWPRAPLSLPPRMPPPPRRRP